MTLNYRINLIPLTFSSLSAFFSAVFPANVLHTVNKSYNVVFFFEYSEMKGVTNKPFFAGSCISLRTLSSVKGSKT